MSFWWKKSINDRIKEECVWNPVFFRLNEKYSNALLLTHQIIQSTENSQSGILFVCIMSVLHFTSHVSIQVRSKLGWCNLNTEAMSQSTLHSQHHINATLLSREICVRMSIYDCTIKGEFYVIWTQIKITNLMWIRYQMCVLQFYLYTITMFIFPSDSEQIARGAVSLGARICMRVRELINHISNNT